jgi:MGT family glycosyltransferase
MGSSEQRRVLFVVFSDQGHINPFLAIAQALEEGGHVVGFASVQEDVSERLQRAGLKARMVGRVSAPPPQPAAPGRSLQLGRLLAKPAFAARWLSINLLDRVPGDVERVREAIGDFKPDIVATDSSAYAGPIAATLEGVPWAGLSTGFFQFAEARAAERTTDTSNPFAALAPARETLFASFGLRTSFRASDAVSPYLNISFLSPELARKGGDVFLDVQYVGSALPKGARGDEPPFPWEKLPPDRPIVYIAFGSLVSHPAEVYRAFVGALGPEEAFFVVSVKDLLDEPFVRELPDHALAVKYVPQLAMLERAAVMVNHGGANSVLECLTFGKPMIVVPMVYDQHVSGLIVERSGAGLVVPAVACTPERCRESLRLLLSEGAPAAERAKEVGRALVGGAGRAAQLLAR